MWESETVSVKEVFQEGRERESVCVRQEGRESVCVGQEGRESVCVRVGMRQRKIRLYSINIGQARRTDI